MAYPTNTKTGAQNLVDLVLALRTSVGQRGSLTTTDKDSIVDAINELVSSLAALRQVVESKTEIDDSVATAGNVWSALKTSTKISEECAAVKNQILNGAGAAYDTLSELATLITTNQSAITALQTVAAGHVKFDAAQSLTAAQKTQARSNIDAASTADVADAKKAGTDAMSALNTFKAEVGATNIDLVSIYENGVS